MKLHPIVTCMCVLIATISIIVVAALAAENNRIELPNDSSNNSEKAYIAAINVTPNPTITIDDK